MINAAAVLICFPSPNGFWGISDNGKLNSTSGWEESCVGESVPLGVVVLPATGAGCEAMKREVSRELGRPE